MINTQALIWPMATDNSKRRFKTISTTKAWIKTPIITIIQKNFKISLKKSAAAHCLSAPFPRGHRMPWRHALLFSLAYFHQKRGLSQNRAPAKPGRFPLYPQVAL